MIVTSSPPFSLHDWFTKSIDISQTSSCIEDFPGDKYTEEDDLIVEELEEPEGPEEVTCRMCGQMNPEFMSTNTAPSCAPPVPVCGLECEIRYLSSKGCWINELDKAASSSDIKVNNISRALHENTKRTELNTGPSKNSRKDSTPENYSLNKIEFNTADTETSKVQGVYSSWWPNALDFYQFVRDRQDVWHIFAQGNWAPVKGRFFSVFKKYKFRNVYRELDRGCLYFRKIYHRQCKKGISLQDVLWMSIVYRLSNKIEVFVKYGGIPLAFDLTNFRKEIVNSETLDSSSFFQRRKYAPKTLREYLKVLSDLADQLESLTDSIRSSTSLQQCFDILLSFEDGYLTPFVAWQVVMDLSDVGVLPSKIDPDSWTWISPRARAALRSIFKYEEMSSDEYFAMVMILQQRQIHGFQTLTSKFSYLFGRRLNLRNIAHALDSYGSFLLFEKIHNKIKNENQLKSTRRTTKRLQFNTKINLYPYKSRAFLDDHELCEICKLGESEESILICELCARLFHYYCIKLKELPTGLWICPACENIELNRKNGVFIPQQNESSSTLENDDTVKEESNDAVKTIMKDNLVQTDKLISETVKGNCVDLTSHGGESTNLNTTPEPETDAESSKIGLLPPPKQETISESLTQSKDLLSTNQKNLDTLASPHQCSSSKHSNKLQENSQTKTSNEIQSLQKIISSDNNSTIPSVPNEESGLIVEHQGDLKTGFNTEIRIKETQYKSIGSDISTQFTTENESSNSNAGEKRTASGISSIDSSSELANEDENDEPATKKPCILPGNMPESNLDIQ